MVMGVNVYSSVNVLHAIKFGAFRWLSGSIRLSLQPNVGGDRQTLPAYLEKNALLMGLSWKQKF